MGGHAVGSTHPFPKTAVTHPGSIGLDPSLQFKPCGSILCVHLALRVTTGPAGTAISGELCHLSGDSPPFDLVGS